VIFSTEYVNMYKKHQWLSSKVVTHALSGPSETADNRTAPISSSMCRNSIGVGFDTIGMNAGAVGVPLRSVISPNHFGSLFANSIGGHLSMATVQSRHHAAVYNSQALHAIYAESLVDDGKGVVPLAHLRRASRMITCTGILLHEWLPVFVGFIGMVIGARRPGALDLILGAGTCHDDFVGEAYTLGHHQ
jgi:hypothetical protein